MREPPMAGPRRGRVDGDEGAEARGRVECRSGARRSRAFESVSKIHEGLLRGGVVITMGGRDGNENACDTMGLWRNASAWWSTRAGRDRGL